jgi:hypothetical protein
VQVESRFRDIDMADKVGLRPYSKSEYKAACGLIPWLDQLFTYAHQAPHQSKQHQTSKEADKYYSPNRHG